jgi:hypothetical protein
MTALWSFLQVDITLPYISIAMNLKMPLAKSGK